MKRLNKRNEDFNECSLIGKIGRLLCSFFKGNVIGAILISPLLLSKYQEEISLVIDKALDFEITDDKMIELINNSDNLSDEEKEYLVNEKFLADIEETINNGDNGVLISYHLDDMRIIPMTERDKKNMPNVAGYYNQVYAPKKLNIRNYCEELTIENKDDISHEFIHSLEGCPYLYIREAFTAIVNSEYYTYDNSYHDEKVRLKVLMEVIGPQPIWEASFTRDASMLDNILDTYLTADEAKKLKELFNRHIVNEENIKKVNREIDELLGVLYYNIYGKTIDSDRVIYALYNYNYGNSLCYINRNYFNIDNNQDMVSYVLDLDTAKKLGYFDEGVVAYIDIWKFEDEYEQIKDEWFSDYSCIDKGYSSKVAYQRLDDNTYVFYDSGNEVYLNYDEAIQKGYLRSVVCLRKEEHIYDLDSFKNMLNLGFNVAFPNENEKGIESTFNYNREYDEINVIIEEYVPTITDKFNEKNIYHNENKTLIYNN